MTIGPHLNPPPADAATVQPAPGAQAPPAPSTRDTVAGVGAAVLITGAALTLFARARFDFGPPLRLPRIGRISEVTLSLAAVALLVLAYHVVVYALRIEGFRAPMWVVLVAGPVAIAGSLALDAVENRSAPTDPD